MQAFEQLAPKYPDICFVFAVRPRDVLEEKLIELESRVSNIDVHIYPYKEGVSLASLLQKAFFVVQPFRSLSINPQMSILETLYAGVPVIATKIESNEELIEDGQTGFLIPPKDKNALVDAIEILLSDRKLCDKMAENAWSKTKLRWNWESFGRGLLEIYNETSS
jgi:glycosyltransferase involved in cell wall biosynthesis